FLSVFRSENARSTHGFGVGLSLVKKIVDLHKGKLEVYSELQQGTCITLHLPTANSNLLLISD
ncbi:MAG: ATP-binding protein, partial [Bacteroidia bacterium]|nr:ATP-binding protein [Bacteroidia bacterium]